MDCKKDCEPEKVCNKLSGRCVKKTGRIGKTILAGPKSKSKIGESIAKLALKCRKKGKMLNTRTLRCIDITKKAKSSVSRSKSKSSVSKVSRKSRVSRSKSNRKKTVDSQIYHPFYKRQIGYKSPENCSSTRQSLSALSEAPKSMLKDMCDFVPLQNITSILGPFMYREYNYNGINISIFGERHQIKNLKTCIKDAHNTVSIANFIKTILILNPKKKYDVYTEIDYINRENIHRPDMWDLNFSLSMVQREFRECLSLTKSGCQYDNLRMHYADPRRNIIPSLRELASMAYGDKAKLTEAFALKILDEVNEVLASNGLIKKELEKSYLKHEISKFIFDELGQLIKQRSRIGNSMDIAALIMDIYTLARMFRQFKKGDPIENIILYAGGLHSATYCKFIETVLKQKPTVSIGKIFYKHDVNCIKVTKRIRDKSVLFN